MKTIVKKVGLHRGHPHLYFQGGELKPHGFDVGVPYTMGTSGDNNTVAHLLVQVCPEMNGCRHVSKKGLTPIVDINTSVLDFLKGHTSVVVEFRQGEFRVFGE